MITDVLIEHSKANIVGQYREEDKTPTTGLREKSWDRRSARWQKSTAKSTYNDCVTYKKCHDISKIFIK